MFELSITETIGAGLQRPECVLSHNSGLVFASDWSGFGGVSVIQPNGNCVTHTANESGPKLRPNGIALEDGGSFLIAHLGDDDGGIFRLHTNGDVEAVVLTADGTPLPPTNFVVKDELGRLWITVSTTLKPRARDYQAGANTGFIAVAEPGSSNARIVAKGLGYTNECVVDLNAASLVVNETFTQKTRRFKLHDDASLSEPTVLAQYNTGTYPDGVAVDANGDFWITSIISNRIIKLSASGQQTLLFEDADDALLTSVNTQFENGALDSHHLKKAHNTQCKNISSLAFGTSDDGIAYVGNLLDDKIYSVQTGVRGRTLSHHNATLGAMEQYIV